MIRARKAGWLFIPAGPRPAVRLTLAAQGATQVQLSRVAHRKTLRFGLCPRRGTACAAPRSGPWLLKKRPLRRGPNLVRYQQETSRSY